MDPPCCKTSREHKERWKAKMDEHKATADGLCRAKTNTAHSSLKGEWRDDCCTDEIKLR